MLPVMVLISVMVMLMHRVLPLLMLVTQLPKEVTVLVLKSRKLLMPMFV